MDHITMNQSHPPNPQMGHVGHNHHAMQIADFKRREVNVVDPMKLHSSSEYPHGLTDKDYDSIVTKDKHMIFNFYGCPWLVHRLTHLHANLNLHVRAYKEEGTITTPFYLRVQNDIDRFHLEIDVINRLRNLGSKGS